MTVKLTLEPLVDDGAAYQCCAEIFIPKQPEWRCEKAATQAISHSDLAALSALKLPWLVLHGRAVCDTHIKMIERDI